MKSAYRVSLRRRCLCAALLVGALLSPQVSVAATPTTRGLAAGGITLGGELVGLTAGVLVGLQLSQKSDCTGEDDGSESCLVGIFVGGVLGGGVGFLAGGLGGAALGGQVTDTPIRRTVGYAALGLGAGALVGKGLGIPQIEPLSDVGGVIFVLGMPVGAGLAAVTYPREGAISDLTLSPTGRGVALSGRF